MRLEATETYTCQDFSNGPLPWENWDDTDVTTKGDAEKRLDKLIDDERSWFIFEGDRGRRRSSVFEVRCYDNAPNSGSEPLWTVRRKVDWEELIRAAH